MHTATKISNLHQLHSPGKTPAQTGALAESHGPLAKNTTADADQRHEDVPEDVQILAPGYDAQEDLTILNILIVDDNRFHRSLIRNALASQGILRHWEAADTKAAEKVLLEETIDLVLVDHDMPDENGISFILRLRDNQTTGNRRVPVIMISAFGDEHIIMTARNVGVHEYVLKPFNVTTLMKRIESVFKHPRDFIIAPGYVGPDRRWQQKLEQEREQALSDNDDDTCESDSQLAEMRQPQVIEA